jgi:CheY-like chemotaxis protein
MLRILIVEDDPFISLDLASQLAKLGFHVGIAATVAAALSILEGSACDIAVLDVNLGNETSAPVASRLAALGVPFVTVTGYAASQCPPEFQNGTVLAKPLRFEALIRELQTCVGRSREEN